MRKLLALLALAVLCPVATARAIVAPATTIDGPANSIVELGGVAMAEDGTGGLVYGKLGSDGREHIYAARFVNQKWLAPARIDIGQNFDSSWPVIGAGNGGRLVVAWVHNFGFGTDRLFSSSLDPGASRFQAPVPIDLNVGEALATFPSLAMNRGGSAYIAYRVLSGTGAQDPNAPPGYFGGEVRVAR